MRSRVAPRRARGYRPDAAAFHVSNAIFSAMGRTLDPNAILREMAREMSIIAATDISADSKKRIFSAFLWGVTEVHGKYFGCPFWSRAALAKFRAESYACAPSLCHEHVVPRKVITAKWLQLSAPTAEQTLALFQRYAIGCVVLREEDASLTREKLRQRMPPEFYDSAHAWHDDPWARYRKAGIEWIGPLEWKGGLLVTPERIAD